MLRRLASAAVLLAACASPGEELAGRVSAAIVNGTASAVRHDFVVQLALPKKDGGPTAACSGSLVAKNLVLTARHCVCDLDADTGRWGTSYPASALSIYVGQDAPQQIRAATAPAAEGKRIVTELADIGEDLAFIVLDRDVDAVVAKLRLDAPVSKAEKVTLAGYGMNEQDTSPDVRMQRSATVTAVAPESSQFHPLSDGEFVTTQGTCYGDSGGAVISAETSAVVGVVAEVMSAGWDGIHLSSNCVGAEAFHTELRPFRVLVDTAFTAARASPQLEAEPTVPVSPRTPTPVAPAGGYVGEGGGGCSTTGRSAPVTFSLVVLALLAQRRRRAATRPTSVAGSIGLAR